MRQNLLNLSNIANILPYYGTYENKKKLVKSLNPKLLPQFKSILGGIFSDADYNWNMYKRHSDFYNAVEEIYPTLHIDLGDYFETRYVTVAKNDIKCLQITYTYPDVLIQSNFSIYLQI